MTFSGKDVANLRMLDFSVRLLFIPFSVASIWIAVTNQEDNPDYGKLEFNNMIGLKYMVCISALSGVYAVFAAMCSYFRFLVTKAWLFFITDQILAYLLVTSMAAFVEFIYLAYNGDQVVSWSEACVSYGKFCSRLKWALAMHVFSVFCFLVLAVISAYRLFKRFEPPYVPNSKDSEQQETHS